jgi:putative ABC transport system permease protein
MYSWGWNGEFQIEGGVPWDAKSAPLVEYRWFYGDYLKTLGVPLLKGRLLDQRDGAKTRTVLINKAMAEKFWPDKDPIGRKFGQGNDVTQWFEVVGVLADIRTAGLARGSLYEFYRNIEQSSFGGMTVVIRTKGADPRAIVPVARQIVNAIDPALPITAVQTLEQVVADSVGQPRLMSALTALFGGLAGLLAMVGIYSVMAYNVRRQRREFGVRIALGANGADVSKLVIGRGLILTVLGVTIGAGGAWFLTRLVETMLNDVKPTDPAVFIGTAFTVLVVGLLASYLPARSAARVDPMIVLRAE